MTAKGVLVRRDLTCHGLSRRDWTSPDLMPNRAARSFTRSRRFLSLLIVLLEQVAELQHRTERAVRQCRHRRVRFAVDRPRTNGGAGLALITALAALALLARDAALTLPREHLPIFTGARAGLVFETDEARTVETDDVEFLVRDSGFECAAHDRRLAVLAVLASGGEQCPIVHLPVRRM